tara:strand:- start:2114 stop:2497 length:384 start_codon:yes stop_codon:yes gene_type:complete
MKLQNVLKHKYFLYAAYALMVVNLLGYVSVSSMECIVVFALATYLCKYCMSKNQGLCIFVGLFAANVLFGCGRVKEGLTNKKGGRKEGMREGQCDQQAAASASSAAECSSAGGNWNTDGTTPVCECA